MAPEQARGGEIDTRADIYGLGATCYHLLAGRTMFEGAPRELIRQHVRVDPQPLHEICPDQPPMLCDLIMRMIAKDPGDRPSNGAAVAQEAENMLSGSSDLDELSTGPRRRRRRRRRRR